MALELVAGSSCDLVCIRSQLLADASTSSLDLFDLFNPWEAAPAGRAWSAGTMARTCTFGKLLLAAQ